MRTQKKNQKRTLTVRGGIRQDISKFIPGEGMWECSGFHPNDTGALTKWPGFIKDLAATLGGPIDGLYQVSLAGTTYKIAMADGEITQVDTGSPIQITSGLTAAPYDAEVLGNSLYVVNGVDHNKKINSSLEVSGVGIAAPTWTPTAVDEGTAGNPNGAYYYKCTYGNSVTGFESDPGPVSAEVTVTSKKITVGNFAASADPQVDRIFVYRTLAGGSRWLLVDEANDTDSSYLDNMADADLGVEIAETNGVPPLARFMEVYNGMIVYAGLASPNESQVAMSGVLLPESHDVEDVYDLDPEEEDSITGLAKFGQHIAVFKKKGLYLGQGTDPQFMDFARTRVSEGCLSNWGIINHKGLLWYPSAHGFYAFDGNTEHYMSQGIEPIYNTFERNPTYPISGIFYPKLNSLIWSCTTEGGDGFPDTLCMYNVKNKEWTTRPAKLTRLTTFLNSVGQSRIWAGVYDGRIWQGDVGNNDDTEGFTATYVSRGGDIDPKNQSAINRFRHVHILYDNLPGAVATVSVSYAIDDPEGAFTPIGSFLASDGTSKTFGCNGQGRRLFVKITTTSTEALVIRGVQFTGHMLGREI